MMIFVDFHGFSSSSHDASVASAATRSAEPGTKACGVGVRPNCHLVISTINHRKNPRKTMGKWEFHGIYS